MADENQNENLSVGEEEYKKIKYTHNKRRLKQRKMQRQVVQSQKRLKRMHTLYRVFLLFGMIFLMIYGEDLIFLTIGANILRSVTGK